MNFKLFLTLSKISIKQTLAYRTSSIIMFFVTILFFVLQISSTYVFYKYTDNIAGYTFMDSINLINTGFIVTSLNYCFFIIGNESIYGEVLEGEMDYKFIRPVDSYWLYTFYGIDLQTLITAILHIIFQIYLFTLQDITFMQIIGYILMIIVGILYMFFISRLIVLIVFYTDKADSIQGMTELLQDVSMKPKGIYPKPIRYILIFIVSYLMVFNGPIDILRENINYIYMSVYIITCILLGIISYKLWYISIKKYQSSN